MINKVTLVGNLGADPESRATSSGGVVVNLRVATTSREKDRDGEWKDATEWHRVVCFGRTAENAAKFLAKGRQVYVEGRIRTNKWTDKDGKDRFTTEIIAHEVKFLGGKGGGRDDSGGGSSGGRDTGRDDSGGDYDGGPDDDIPF